MPANPAYKAIMTVLDHSGEKSSWSVNTLAARLSEGEDNTEWDALNTAANALLDGLGTRSNFTQTNTHTNAKFAATGQREQKFLVTYEDNLSLASYSFEMPCRKTSLSPAAGTDEYDITASPFAAFVTALQAYAVSPEANSITVLSIRLIGKNT